MPHAVAVTFNSLEISQQQIVGEPNDHALTTVHFDVEYADGRVERDVTAQVWHALGPLSGGIVRVIVSGACAPLVRESDLAHCIEAYYRRRVGADTDRVRTGIHHESLAVPQTGGETRERSQLASRLAFTS
jgi:hypothetical protein